MQVSLKKVLIVGPIRYRPIPGIFLLPLLLLGKIVIHAQDLRILRSLGYEDP